MGKRIDKERKFYAVKLFVERGNTAAEKARPLIDHRSFLQRSPIYLTFKQNS